MKRWVGIVRGVVGFTAACVCASVTASAAAEPPKAAAPQAKPEAVLPITEFMAHVVAYSAQNLWNRQGWISDKTGTHSLLPKNEQEWTDAESAALTLSEVIGILLEPGRRMNFPGWERHALHVQQIAQQEAAVAEKHDVDAFMNLGSELEEACEECHKAAGVK